MHLVDCIVVGRHYQSEATCTVQLYNLKRADLLPVWFMWEIQEFSK